MQEEPDYFSSIARGQVGQERVSGNSPKRERRKKFFYGILHGPGGNKKWSDGERRRQKSRDGDGTEPPSFEELVNFFHLPRREPALERSSPSFASQPVGDVASDHSAYCGHQGVVNPRLLRADAQNHQHDIHAARKRNGGIVEEAEGNQAHAAEVDKPAPHAVRRGGRCCGNHVADDYHFQIQACILPCNSREF